MNMPMNTDALYVKIENVLPLLIIRVMY